ncbi:MAG: hypothetical protein ACKOAR_08305, partial [Bacteroidota bacterium]
MKREANVGKKGGTKNKKSRLPGRSSRSLPGGQKKVYFHNLSSVKNNGSTGKMDIGRHCGAFRKRSVGTPFLLAGWHS